MEPRPHVALVGMMGSGKSTVGFWLAQSEGWAFADLDKAIAERQGRSIPEIFATDGEDHFRGLEHEMLTEMLLHPHPLVISCGGGIVVRAENRKLLRNRTWVCWLRATIETVTKRVRSGVGRPLLGDDPAFDLAAIHQARAGLYAEVAHNVVDVDELNIEQIVEQIKQDRLHLTETP